MIQVRKGSAYAALLIIVLMAILFIGFFTVMEPFANIYSRFMDDSDLEAYVTKDSCESHRGIWNGVQCQKLPDQAKSVMVNARRNWLLTPIIFVVGLIIWGITTALRREQHEYAR